MNALHKETPGFARTMLSGLAIECPRDEEIEGCPLHEIRKQSLAEKFSWVTSLSVDELSKTYSAHRVCLDTKKV